MPNLCIYSGSSFGASPQYQAAAVALATACVHRGWGVVYGGASIGLMGAVADAALAAGGQVIGVIPHSIGMDEIAHPRITQIITVDSMHERKQRMADLSDAFVALPGGIGTLEEITEIFTWLRLRIHNKPVGVLNTDGYYDLLLQFLLHMRDQEFLAAKYHKLLTVEREVEPLLDQLRVVKK